MREVKNEERQTIVEEILEDFRHIRINTSYELRKHMRRKRIFVALFFCIVMPILIYVIPTAFDMAPPDRWEDFAKSLLGFVDIIIIICAAMFIGDCVSGELEKKTALITYTSPQRRTSIFLGKYLAGILLMVLLITVYYLIALAEIHAIYTVGVVEIDFLVSYLLAIVYIFLIGSLAFLFSAVLKRMILSTILIILLQIMILPIFQLIFQLIGREPWFLYSYSSSTIVTIFGQQELTLMDITYYVPEYATAVGVMAAYAMTFFLLGMGIALRRQVQ